MAPLMSATVMIAKTAWKATKDRLGIGYASEMTALEPIRSFIPQKSVGLPTSPCQLSPKDIEKPYRTQMTEIRPRAPKLIIIMLSTLLPRTMPP